MKAPAEETGFLVPNVVHASFIPSPLIYKNVGTGQAPSSFQHLDGLCTVVYNYYLTLINGRDKFREMARCIMFTTLFRLVDRFNFAADLLSHGTTCMKATT